MRDALKDMLGSKKFLASLAGIVAVLLIRVAGHFGIALDDATAASVADRVVLLVGTYVGGQAIADHGKEAAAVKAEAEAKS